MAIRFVRNNQRLLRSPFGTISRLLASDQDAFRDLLVTTWIDDEVRNTRTHFRMWATFEREFRTLVRAISRQYGKPAFLGNCADEGYPEWFAEDCAHLAA